MRYHALELLPVQLVKRALSDRYRGVLRVPAGREGVDVLVREHIGLRLRQTGRQGQPLDRVDVVSVLHRVCGLGLRGFQHHLVPVSEGQQGVDYDENPDKHNQEKRISRKEIGREEENQNKKDSQYRGYEYDRIPLVLPYLGIEARPAHQNFTLTGLRSNSSISKYGSGVLPIIPAKNLPGTIWMVLLYSRTASL